MCVEYECSCMSIRTGIMRCMYYMTVRMVKILLVLDCAVHIRVMSIMTIVIIITIIINVVYRLVINITVIIIITIIIIINVIALMITIVIVITVLLLLLILLNTSNSQERTGEKCFLCSFQYRHCREYVMILPEVVSHCLAFTVGGCLMI